MRVEVGIRRATPAGPSRVDRFEVEVDERNAVLDLLLGIVREHDPTIAVRYACRVGMCGTCGMVVNGRERLACQVQVRDLGRRIELEPLRNLPIVKDLVVDMSPFFAGYEAIRPASRGVIGDSQESKGGMAGLGDCITCGLCVSACTMVAFRPGFVGPAALFRAARLVEDGREPEDPHRAALLLGVDGIYGCRGHLDCLTACPKHLPLPQVISRLKRRAVVAEIRSMVRRS